MAKTRLKKNDPVIVVKGREDDKGKVSKILRLLHDDQRAVVEKVHQVKEYVRPNPQKNIQGGIVEREGAVPLAQIMFYCKECEQGVRLGVRRDGKQKQRICKKCGTVVD